MLRRFDQGAQFRARTSACPLGSVVLAVFLLLVSCASVPSPGTPSDALLITVVDGPVQGAAVPVVSESYIIEGPEQLRNTVSHREWNYHTDRVPAGTYRLVSRRLELADGSTRTLSYDPAPEVAVGPSSIVLLPWKLGARVAPEDGADESSAVGLYAPTPEDQRRAAEDLSDLIATFSWAGRRTYGFGPFSPFGNLGKESYRLEVATQPADARLSIDRQVWGRTPIVADLSPGRHFLLIERAGYEPYRSFVDLQADGRENFVLKKAAASVDASQAKMTALLEPFTNLGGENEAYLSEIFASSLEVTLGRDGLDIRRAASRSGRGLNGETTGESDLPAGPDFSTAESIGSQCVIAGDYRVVGGAILVHAALYDTRTHLVKTSTLFKGVAGTEIFSSIDTMSDRFSNAVRKVLPDVGQQVVEQRSLDSDTVSFDQRVADQAVIALRNRRRYAVEIIALQDDVFDSVARPTDGKLELRDYGPEVGAAVGFETVVAGQFSLAARAGVVTSIGANVERLITVPILFGPVVTFPTPHSDIFTGISASVRYCSRATVRFHDDSTAQYGPYWAFGANLDLGLRTYLNRRLSGLSDFLVYGLSFGLLGLRTDIDLSNPSPYAMALQLFLGWGTRL